MAKRAAIDAKRNEAFEHHRQGRLAEAEALYRELLSEAPRNGWTVHMLGVLEWQRGRHASAVDLLREAVAIEPGSAAAHSNLGLALQASGDFEAALASCNRALSLQPDHAEALVNRGHALRALGRADEALASYGRALEVRPDFADAHFGCGQALEGMRRHAEAAASFGRAVALRPDNAEWLYRLANVSRRLGRQEEAVALFDRALAGKPDLAEAYSNRGNALLALGRREEALASYDRALAIAPAVAEAHNNRGNVLRELGRYDEALSACDVAIRLDPGFAEAFNNRGNVLLDMRRADEALVSYERALALEPDFAEAHNNRGNALRELRQEELALASYDRALALEPRLAAALDNRGTVRLDLHRYAGALSDFDQALRLDPANAEAMDHRAAALRGLKRYDEAARAYAELIALAPRHAYAEGNLLNCLLHSCAWAGVADRIRRIDDAVRRGERAVHPFFYLATSTSPADQLQCARLHADACLPETPAALWTGQRYAHDRIRIAYVSADFHDHATAYLMAGLFEAHDRRRFEITAISLGPDARSPMRDRLVRGFDRFLDVRRMSDRDAAQCMRDHEIDIAVDLKGYTEGGRPGILAHRPAPVQVSYLGYPGTMGASFIDYIIADAFVVPPGDDAFYSEKIVRLPDTYQVNDAQRTVAEGTPARAELGLPDDGFVFCCFNNNYKIMPDVFAIWMRLLDAVPGSVLWLLEGNAAAAENLRREAQGHGIAAKRLVFAPRMKLGEHLARHRRADLFLDTLPYNAHTTASDALWAGLPVLTCVGNTFAGRVAESLVRAAGLPGLITRTLDDYQALALRLATMPALLATMRAELARQRAGCPLFDTDRFRRHIENAYVTMRERVERGQAPESFQVPSVDADRGGAG